MKNGELNFFSQFVSDTIGSRSFLCHRTRGAEFFILCRTLIVELNTYWEDCLYSAQMFFSTCMSYAFNDCLGLHGLIKHHYQHPHQNQQNNYQINLRWFTYPLYHDACTCPMGPKSDPQVKCDIPKRKNSYQLWEFWLKFNANCNLSGSS